MIVSKQNGSSTTSRNIATSWSACWLVAILRQVQIDDFLCFLKCWLSFQGFDMLLGAWATSRNIATSYYCLHLLQYCDKLWQQKIDSWFVRFCSEYNNLCLWIWLNSAVSRHKNVRFCGVYVHNDGILPQNFTNPLHLALLCIYLWCIPISPAAAPKYVNPIYRPSLLEG